MLLLASGETLSLFNAEVIVLALVSQHFCLMSRRSENIEYPSLPVQLALMVLRPQPPTPNSSGLLTDGEALKRRSYGMKSSGDAGRKM
jgi:hypothetical protein